MANAKQTASAEHTWFVRRDTIQENDGTTKQWWAAYEEKADAEPFCIAYELDEGRTRFVSAAPDLLKACKELYADEDLYSHLASIYGDWRAGNLCGFLRTAIAKAEGK